LIALAPHPFRTAIEAGDAEGLIAALHPEVTLVDPVVGFTWQGRDRVLALAGVLATVYEDVEYTDELAGEGTRALCFRLSVDGHRIEGVDHLGLDDDGRVRFIATAMRPLASVQALAVRMADHIPRLLAGHEPGEQSGRVRIASWDDPRRSAEAVARMSGFYYLRAVRDGDLPAPPVGALVGFRLDGVEEGRVSVVGEPAEGHRDHLGAVHGAFTTPLLDFAMASAVHSTLPPGGSFTVRNLNVDLLTELGPADGPVRCTGQVVLAGDRATVAEGRLTSQRTGELLASATAQVVVV
jgi:acyl-coenzyme A thioesterase PaaI-like protein